MLPISCGIDFGTSNSSVAVAHEGIKLVPVENNSVTIPSALFFVPRVAQPLLGRSAIDHFFERKEGRFMRSLKRVLGTSLMKNGTMVNGRILKFEDIIGFFLTNLKTKTDAFAGVEIENVVMGRPVHFIDNDPEGDKRAQEELKKIALKTGFKNVEFQYEPIAAAFAHEVNVTGEKLAIVVDLGGGTSDFTVIRLSNKNISKRDRTSDILANTGVRVGGNDFDKELGLSAIMPELGYRSVYGPKKLEVPLKYFHDLAEWSKVNFLYTPKNIIQVRQYIHESHDKKRLSRLLRVLENESGHAVLAAAEDTKIALTSLNDVTTPLEFLEKGYSLTVTRRLFEESIQPEVDKIASSAQECIELAGVTNHNIDLVILTGGSTEVPLIQAEFKRLFPHAAIADENKLSSVGLGLAYDSQNRFR